MLTLSMRKTVCFRHKQCYEDVTFVNPNIYIISYEVVKLSAALTQELGKLQYGFLVSQCLSRYNLSYGRYVMSSKQNKSLFVP